VYQPELTVQIVTPKIQFLLTGLLDSGADMTLLPAEDLEAYGIMYADLDVIEDGGRAQGVNEDCSFEYRRANGLLRWHGETFANEILVVEPGKIDMGLLGRADFFNTFNVSFEGWREATPWMDISPYPRDLHLA
jgi:hypothetical protein